MKTLISKAEIEEIGESLISKYIGDKPDVVFCTDIEGFITDFLHYNIEYLEIADDDKLGFLSDGISTIDVIDEGVRKTILLPVGYIIIARKLLSTIHSGKRRFTLAHEAAHILICRMCPLYTGALYRRDFCVEREYNAAQLHERLNCAEMQADSLASVLLMPRFLVERVKDKIFGDRPIVQYGNAVFTGDDKLAIDEMADTLGVTFHSLIIRLRTLKMIQYKDIEEFIDTELSFGGN